MVELLVAATLLLQDDPKVFVKDGKAPAVYYGWSPVLDLWGNIRRGVIALRADGTIFWGAPRDSFEQFAARALTDEEKQSCGRYEIRGGTIEYTYRDGSAGKGDVEYHADGSIKIIKANLLRYFPIRPGVPFELTGYWSNTTSYNNAAYKMSTTAYSNYSFFKGGLFVLESGAGTIATAVEQRTTERTSGSDVIVETVRQEVTKFYGGEAAAKMGKYRVAGSGLVLEYDNGTKETKFLGTIQVDEKEGCTILLGGALYEGRPGVFPKSSGAAPPPPPAPVSARCKTPQFELDGPPGWTLKDQEQEGTKIHFLLPAGVSADEPYVVILMGAVLDRATKATDPGMPKELEGIVKMLAGTGTVKSAGAAEKLTIDLTDAVRAPFTIEQEGRPFRVEVTIAIRDGNAMVALALGSETGVRTYAEAARKSIAGARLAAAARKERHASAHFELELPKGWRTKETEQDGTKYMVLAPPGRDPETDTEFNAFAVGVVVGDQYKSATEKAAVDELRGMIRQIAPGSESQGEPEQLKADGEPAILVKHVTRNDAGETVLVRAYMVVKHGKAVILMLVGKEKPAEQFAATVREAFESLKVKK